MSCSQHTEAKYWLFWGEGRSTISHSSNLALLRYLLLNALKAVSQASAYHLFSQKSNENISGKTLSDVMDHVHLYEFHRRTHKLDSLPCRRIWPNDTIVTHSGRVRVTTTSVLKSNPHVAGKIDCGREKSLSLLLSKPS